jgi:hypothetical protein
VTLHNALGRLRRLLVAVAAVALPLVAWSFPIGPQPPSPSRVVEYFNTALGHYFYTVDAGEQAAIEAGRAGPGWVKTGLAFYAFPTLESSRFEGAACDSALAACRPVSRFYAASPNSHFFTGNPVEAEILKQPGSGWRFEGIAFHVPLPDAAGRCVADVTARPVFRLYNNRARFNDANHRFTGSESARQLLLAQGWIDEGVAFCTYAADAAPVESVAFGQSDPEAIQPLSVCKAGGSASLSSCVGLENLPVPRAEFTVTTPEVGYDLFNAVVGWRMPGQLIRNLAVADQSREAAADNTFVQLTTHNNGYQLALHLDTANRGSAMYSSISPIRKLGTAAPANGEADTRFFPFRRQYGTDYEMQMDFHLGLKLFAAVFGSDAYGGSSIEFLDTRSGRKLQFNVLAYGTVPDADFVTVDPKTGMPRVAATFGRGSRYGRLVGSVIRQATSDTADRGRAFSATINRTEFQALIEDARRFDPALSTDPFDYVIHNFGVLNEVYGEGEIAMWMAAPVVSRKPQP